MYVLSLSRGFISVCVPIEDIGKIFAFMSTLDGLTPIIMAQFYTFIWQVSSSIVDTFINNCIVVGRTIASYPKY